MKMLITISTFFFIFCAMNQAIAEPVNICSDHEDWAPFTYFPRVNGVADKSRQIGITQDLLKEIFKIVGLKYSVTKQPWKRCIMEVDNFGKNQKFEMFIDGTFNMERMEKYYLSMPIYSTHQALFYSKKKFPDGLPLKKLSDLNKFTFCGVLGYNYEEYYSDYGLLRSKKIDQGAKSLPMALNKIDAGRCDVLGNGVEIVYGGVAVGAYTLPPSIRSMKLPGVEPTTFHIFIAKTSPRAHELLTKINQAILVIQHNGVSKKIFKKYLPEQN